MSDGMYKDLKPCPFCGHTDHTGTHHPNPPWFEYYFLACDFCGCKGPMEDLEHEAVTAWNRRVEEAKDEN